MLENTLPSIRTVEMARPAMAAAAQRVYDDWDEADQDTYAGGGICHLIADEMINLIDAPASTISSTYEVHVYIVVQAQEGVFEVDIPWNIYERGGGYSWTKIPNIHFEPDDIRITLLDRNPDNIHTYVEEWD